MKGPTAARPKPPAARRAYHQRQRANSAARTRRALLEAAEREFFDGLWEQASLESIAARAGVTKQTLLRHFGSRDRLLEQAMLRAQDAVRDERWAVPRDDVAAAVDNLIDHYERHGKQALAIAALDGRQDFAGQVNRRARQLHYDWVEHAFAGALSQLRGRARARRRAGLIALCDVHTWSLLTHDLGLSRKEVRSTLIDAITRLTQETT
jgi:AcrR family transcriptional regulator